MKRLELTVPFSLLEDLGILSARFFEHNESVEVLQSFPVRPDVAALIVRVRRRGPFKDPDAVRREERAIARRYRVERFEILSSDAARGEYVAWIEWSLPEFLRREAGGNWGGVVPLAIAQAEAGEARVAVLATEAVLPRVRRFLDRLGATYRVRAIHTAAASGWQTLAGLTPRQRQVLELAFQMGYYETPARVSLDRLARFLGISKAAVSKHLRTAQRKILRTALEAVPG